MSEWKPVIESGVPFEEIARRKPLGPVRLAAKALIEANRMDSVLIPFGIENCRDNKKLLNRIRNAFGELGVRWFAVRKESRGFRVWKTNTPQPRGPVGSGRSKKAA